MSDKRGAENLVPCKIPHPLGGDTRAQGIPARSEGTPLDRDQAIKHLEMTS
jgi:hypothetical protein